MIEHVETIKFYLSLAGSLGGLEHTFKVQNFSSPSQRLLYTWPSFVFSSSQWFK